MDDSSMLPDRTFCRWRRALQIVLLVGAMSYGASAPAVTRSAKSPGPVLCRVGIIDGEVAAGQVFERPIGNGLRIFLEPLASGWLLRVLPAQGPRGRHDYAELATPPYQSVSPLLVSTDYSFRAQDALAWNPRHFRFATERSLFADLQSAYDAYQRLAKPGPAANEKSRQLELRQTEARLAMLVESASDGELIILDAHLVQGTADQARAAAMVASHLKQSAHEVDQPADGKSTSLGRLNSLRFQIRLNLPAGFHAEDSLAVERSACP